MRLAVTDALRTAKRLSATQAAAISVLEAENAALSADNDALRERLSNLENLDEARWAVDHITWPDGRVVTRAEEAAARDVLRADRIARDRKSLTP